MAEIRGGNKFSTASNSRQVMPKTLTGMDVKESLKAQRKGGRTVVLKLGRKWMAEIGRRGGKNKTGFRKREA
jgi:hypothetical protein